MDNNNNNMAVNNYINVGVIKLLMRLDMCLSEGWGSNTVYSTIIVEFLSAFSVIRDIPFSNAVVKAELF